MEIKAGTVIEVGGRTYTVRAADDKFVSYVLQGGPFEVMHGMVSRKFFMRLISGDRFDSDPGSARWN